MKEAIILLIAFIPLTAYLLFTLNRRLKERFKKTNFRPTAENEFIIPQRPAKVKKRYPRPGVSRTLIARAYKQPFTNY